MPHKITYCLVLAIFTFTMQISGQNKELTKDNYKQLISKAQHLETGVDIILQKQDAFKNNPDSISLSSDSAIFITSSDIYEKLTAINQLKLKYYNAIASKIDSSLNNDSKYAELQHILLKNGKLKIQQNSPIISNGLQNVNIDLSSVFEQVKTNQEIALCALKISQDINDHKQPTIIYLSTPLNIEDISEYYNISPDQLVDLLTPEQSATIESETAKPQSEKVIKGYSPFSDVYQEFIFFADSLSKTEEESTTSARLDNHQNINSKTNITINKNQREELLGDTLYNKAMNDSLFPTELISRFDKESLKRYWKIYQNQWSEPMISQNQINIDKINYGINRDITIHQMDNKEKDVIISNSSTHVPEKSLPKQVQSKTIAKESNLLLSESLEETQTLPYNNSKSIDSGKTYYFIQVAASRTLMSSQLTNSLCKGKDSLIIRQEEGWYKYQYGKTTDYSVAKKEVLNSNVPGTFIVAYKSNEKQTLWKTLSTYNYSSVENHLTFTIQLSANKTRISTTKRAELQQKAGGFIREIEEDGWYKYQFVVGPSYKAALQKWKEIGTNISFIVAYYDNEKIEMNKAIQTYKRNKTN